MLAHLQHSWEQCSAPEATHVLELIIPCLSLPERAEEKQCWPHLPIFTAVAPIHRASQSLCCVSAAATPAPHVTQFFLSLSSRPLRNVGAKRIAQYHEKSHHLPLTMEKPDSYGILKEWRWAESLPTQYTGSKTF